MPDYPAALTAVNHVEPVPRRIRAVLGGQTVVDTVAARYVWEWPNYPQYYVPLADFRPGVLEAEGEAEASPRGTVEWHGLRAGSSYRPHAARVLGAATVAGLDDTVRVEWDAVDAWFEEDEEVFVHPRSPYTRVDAIRSTRTVRVELGGILLGQSPAPVMVFETGLPTRYYLNRTEVDFSHLVPSGTRSRCPYKGTTTGLLVGRRRRRPPPRPGLVLRLSHRRPPADRRPGGLLRRAGRHLRRRGAPGAPGDPLLCP